MGNSAFLAIATVIIGGAANALAGFAFGNFEFRASISFSRSHLLTFMVPVAFTANTTLHPGQ